MVSEKITHPEQSFRINVSMVLSSDHGSAEDQEFLITPELHIVERRVDCPPHIIIYFVWG